MTQPPPIAFTHALHRCRAVFLLRAPSLSRLRIVTPPRTSTGSPGEHRQRIILLRHIAPAMNNNAATSAAAISSSTLTTVSRDIAVLRPSLFTLLPAPSPNRLREVVMIYRERSGGASKHVRKDPLAVNPAQKAGRE